MGVSVPPPVIDPQNGVYTTRRPPKRARSNGEHAYTMNLEAYFDGTGTWGDPRPGFPTYTGTIKGCWGGVAFDFTSWTANDDLTLIGKLREAIIGSDFNPAVTLAEGKESLETIANGADALAGMIYHARRGNLPAAAKSLASFKRGQKYGDTAAGVNLNIQYGIKPILNDVYNAAITLAHLTSAPQQDVITVTHKRNGRVYSLAASVLTFNGWCWKAKKIKYIRREANITKLIGLTDPLQVAWEIVPYSFVVDWFVPIGDYLQALGVSNSLTGTFVTTIVEKGYGGQPSPKDKSSLWIAGGMLRYYRRIVNVTRQITTSLDVPVPTIKPLSEWATWRHAVDAVSLLTGLRDPKE